MKPRVPTAFQRRVYAVVKRIPRGQTRSYRWVAEQLGNPGLARAIGQALTRNSSPETVPCHRVIRADGSLGGYAWGAARKGRLLRMERRPARRGDGEGMVDVDARHRAYSQYLAKEQTRRKAGTQSHGCFETAGLPNQCDDTERWPGS